MNIGWNLKPYLPRWFKFLGTLTLFFKLFTKSSLSRYYQHYPSKVKSEDLINKAQLLWNQKRCNFGYSYGLSQWINQRHTIKTNRKKILVIVNNQNSSVDTEIDSHNQDIQSSTSTSAGKSFYFELAKKNYIASFLHISEQLWKGGLNSKSIWRRQK